MNYTIAAYLFFSAILSGFSVFLFKINNRTLKLILSFSGAYLFAICVLHLIPETYSGQDKLIGVFILIGFFLQVFLELFSEGIEHGHIHKHSNGVYPFLMMTGLSIHSFLEGIPLANRFSITLNDIKVYDYSLVYGIIMHNIPVAIALMSMLMQSGIKKTNSLLSLLFFSGMAPLGMLTSVLVGENIALSSDRVMAIVIGIFLHISTTILFESSENHRFNLIKFLTIILGAGIALISL